jgi:hypothetical protein
MDGGITAALIAAGTAAAHAAGSVAATIGPQLLIAGATAGVGAGIGAARNNAKINSSIEANNRTAGEFDKQRLSVLAQQRMVATQFQREAEVKRGNLLAQRAALGGVGGTSDLLSALATSQSLEAQSSNMDYLNQIRTGVSQQQELYRQSVALGRARQNPIGEGILAGGSAIAMGMASRPKATLPITGTGGQADTSLIRPGDTLYPYQPTPAYDGDASSIFSPGANLGIGDTSRLKEPPNPFTDTFTPKKTKFNSTMFGRY